MNTDNLIKPFPLERRLIVDSGSINKNNHRYPVFLECDVTEVRQHIRDDREGKERGISFTAFIAYCLVQTVTAHKEINSYRKGRNEIIVFEDIDLIITQEVKTKDGYFPGAVTIRAAQNYTISEIQTQQRKSIASVNPEDVLPPELKSFAKLPQFIRRWILWYIQRDPIRRKNSLGTILLSSVGMYGDIRWFYASPNYTLSVFLGGIIPKPGVKDGEIAIREYLHVTLIYDHDLIDAAPVARFAQAFKELVENGAGLV